MSVIFNQRIALPCIAFLLSILAAEASAGELSYQMSKVRLVSSPRASQSGCDSDQISLVQSGNQVSLVFDQFNSALLGGVNGGQNDRPRYHYYQHCEVYLTVKLPRGYYVDSFDQTVIHGIEKSSKSFAYIDTQTSLFGGVITDRAGAVKDFNQRLQFLAHDQRIYKFGQSVSEPIVDRSSQKAMTRDAKRRLCRATKNGDVQAGLLVKFTIGASRSRTVETVELGLDSYDAKINLSASPSDCQRL